MLFYIQFVTVRVCAGILIQSWPMHTLSWGSSQCYIYNVKDPIRSNQSLDRYCNIDISFATTREFKLLQELTAACEEHDTEAFTTSVFEFDRLSKLGMHFSFFDHIRHLEDDYYAED